MKTEAFDRSAETFDRSAQPSDGSAEPMPATAGAETMKAIVQDEYGTAPEEVLRLAEIARPTIADDEILVRVRAASVDRGTWHLMAGLPYPMRLAGFGLRTPKATNPGRSVAGTVEAVGKEVIGTWYSSAAGVLTITVRMTSGSTETLP